MTQLKVKKYTIQSPNLRPFIKYIWHIDDAHPIHISNKWLPINNIDIILNFSGPIIYQDQNKTQTIHNAHLNGIRQRHMFAEQHGKGHVFGISFFPHGLYPFFKIPMQEFTNQTIVLEDIFPEWTQSLMNDMESALTVQGKLKIIEHRLSTLLPGQPNDFQPLTLDQSCNLSTRTRQRYFKKFIGISPKQFYNITRFQQTLNRIINHSFEQWTDLVFDYNYFDQAHFIHEFKSFTGVSPTQFHKKKTSIKEIILTP